MLSILPHTHAFKCSRPGPASVYLASQPTVTGSVNTDRITYPVCTLRTARLNDDCRPQPSTVAPTPHYPHTRPPDVPARLVYQIPSPAVVPPSTSLVLDAAAATCLTARKTLRLPAVLSAAVRAALLIDMMMIVIVLGANLTSDNGDPIYGIVY
jgi:hypothetical protein